MDMLIQFKKLPHESEGRLFVMFQDFLNYSICVVPRLIEIMYQRIVKLQKEFINIEYYEDYNLFITQ